METKIGMRRASGMSLLLALATVAVLVGGFALPAAAQFGPSYERNIGDSLNMRRFTTRQVEIGFDFPYYGQTFTSVNINSHGYLSFTQGERNILPNVAIFLGRAGFRQPRIAPAWNSWEVSCCRRGSTAPNVYLRRDTENNRLIITWNNVAELWDRSVNQFQVILHGGNSQVRAGTINFNYGRITNFQNHILTGISPGTGGGSAVDLSTLPIPPASGALYEFFIRGTTRTVRVGTRIVRRRIIRRRRRSPFSFFFRRLGRTRIVTRRVPIFRRIRVPGRPIDLSGRSIFFNPESRGSMTIYSVADEAAAPEGDFPLAVTPQNSVVSNSDSTAEIVAVGGVAPYSWKATRGQLSSTSGDMITYTRPAGFTGADTVFLTDSAGTMAQAEVTVVGALLTITPQEANVGIGETVNFQIQGGLAPFSIVASEGTLNNTTGPEFVYTAPDKQGEHTVTVTDAVGSSVEATVVTDLGVEVTPGNAIVSRDDEGEARQVALTAVNGTPPYSWRTTAGQISDTSGETITFTAPDFTVDALVHMQDSRGSMQTAVVEVVAEVSVTPQNITTEPGTPISLTALGGVPATDPDSNYSWTASEGALDNTEARSVSYITPNRVGEFTVTVEDSRGSSATVNITNVNPRLALNPSVVNLSREGQQLFSVTGGEGPFTFTVTAGSISTEAATAAVLSKRQTTSNSQVVYSAPNFSGEFTVQVRDNGGRNSSATVTVVGPLMLTPGRANLEPSGTQQFVAIGGTAPITWTADSGNVSQSGLYTAPSITGEAMVTATDASGETASAVISITDSTIRLSPIFQRVARDGTINFNVSGGTGAYSWEVGRGLLDRFDGDAVVYTAPGNTGADFVRVTDTQGNSARARIFVIGTFSMTPETAIVDAGRNVQFQLAGGVPPFAFKASAGQVFHRGRNRAIFRAPSVSGEAVVTAIDGAGDEVSAVLTVILPESITLTPSLVTVPLGGTQGFSVTGGTGEGFVWSAQQGSLSPTTGPSVTYTAPELETTDTVTVRDNQGNEATASINITGQVNVTPATANLNVGESIELTASGGTGLFNWTASGGNLSSTTGATVSFTPPSISGAFSVTATDTASNSASANITVQAVRFDVSPANAQLDLGGEARFAAIGGTPPYTWSVEGGGVVDPTSTESSDETVTYFAPSNARVDKVTAIDSRGNIATAEVIVGTGLSLTPQTASVGFGGLVQFTAVGGVTPLTWSASQGSFDSNTGRAVSYTAPAQTGNFTVTVSDGAGNTAEAEITVANFPVVTPQQVFGARGSSHTFSALGGSPPYTWSADAGNVSPSTGASTTFTAPGVGGEFNITLSDAQGFSARATAFIDLPLGVTPEMAAGDTGSQVTLTASGGIPPFNWSATAGDFDSTTGTAVTYTLPNTFGTETVTVRDASDSSATATINVVAPLRITPEFASVDRNATQTFNAVGGRGPFSWSAEAGDLSSTEGETIVYTAPSIGDRDFIVTLTDNTGQEVTATVAVDRRLRITPRSATIEPGGRRRFVAQGGVTLEGAEFIWTSTNGSFVDPESGEEILPEGRIITFQAPSTVGVAEITTIDLEDSEATAVVTIARPVRVTPSSARGVQGGQTLVFQAVDGAPPYTWTASAGDLDTTEGSTVMYTAPDVRSDIQLTVVDNAGKSATANIEVTGKLRITPGSANVGPGEMQSFTALNGVGPYIWTSSAGQFIPQAPTEAQVEWQATNLLLGQDATITVVDAQDKEATATVFVAPRLNISPTQSLLGLGGSQGFVGTGGTPPYTWSVEGQGNLSTPTSGEGETVTYSAPNVSGENTVLLTDTAGQTAQALVTIRQTLRVTPGSVVVDRGESVRLSSVGGTGDNIWVASSGQLSSTTGSVVNFTAPITSGVFTVEVIDTEESTASVTVLVNEGGIQVTPGMATLEPGGSTVFSASGGTGSFRWSIDAGFLSSVRGDSVNYTAPAITGEFLVTATDSAGNSGTALVEVSGALRVTPGAATTTPGGNVNLQATGGAGGITWSAPEGGSLNPVSGESTTFVAPSTTGRVHVVAVDGAGSQASAVIEVINNQINVTPGTANVETGGTVEFTASGGTGVFTWIVEAGGVSVDSPSAMTYTAPGVTGDFNVLVLDNAGNGGMASVTVSAPDDRLIVTPSDVSLDQGQEVVFNVAGGTPPYSWSTGGATPSGIVGPSDILGPSDMPVPLLLPLQGPFSTFTGLEAGSFVITATDAEGRQANGTVTVEAAPENDQVPTILMAGFSTTAIDYTSTGGGTVTVQAQVIDDGGPEGLTVEMFTDQSDETRNVLTQNRFETMKNVGNGIFEFKLDLPPGVLPPGARIALPGFRIVATDVGGNQGSWPAINVRNEATTTPPPIPDPPLLSASCAPFPVIAMAGFRATPFTYGTSSGGSAEIVAQVCGGSGAVSVNVSIGVPGLFGGPSITAPLLSLNDADGNGIFESGALPIDPGLLPLGEFDLNFGIEATDGVTTTSWPELNTVN